EFVSLFDLTNRPAKAAPLSDNGIHLDAAGYARAAETIAGGLRWKTNSARFTKLSDLETTREGARFTASGDRLDAKPAVQVAGLRSGDYELRMDGASVCTASASEWKRGVTLERGPIFEQAGQLRQAIAR